MRREFEKIKAEYEQNWRDQKEFDDERRERDYEKKN